MVGISWRQVGVRTRSERLEKRNTLISEGLLLGALKPAGKGGSPPAFGTSLVTQGIPAPMSCTSSVSAGLSPAKQGAL